MTTRVLMVSGVRHGYDYANLLADLPDAELVACTEAVDAPDWARSDTRSLAQHFGLPFVALDKGLEMCDAAIVCSEPVRHARLAVSALEAGRHVLVDKPAAVNSRDCELLVRAAAQAPGAVLTAVHRLLSPSIARARDTIDSGAIGLPLIVDAEWLAAGGLDGSTVERPELVCDPALSGGGELLNFGWYPVLAIGYLTGLRAIEVTAFGGCLFGADHARFGVEDSAILSMLLERGVTATITVARVPVGLSAQPATSTMRILGSHGHLFLDEQSNFASVRTRAPAGSSPPTSVDSAARRCLAEFLAAVRGEAGVTLGVAEMAAALSVLDAARDSLESGDPTTVVAPPEV